jgi:hypothetical protein
MHFLLILALTVMMVSSGISVMTSRKLESAEAVKVAGGESYVVESFVLVAKSFVAANPYSVSGNNDLNWAAIQTTPGVPVGSIAANVPATWRVRRTATDWVVCASVMSELAVQNVLGKTDLMPAGSNALISLSGTTKQFVLGVQDANTKAALITRCA